MKKIIVLLFLISAVLALWFCQSKLFKKVHVTGRLIHFYTGEPVAGVKVELRADDATSAKQSQENTQTVGSATSTSDGYFSIKGNASKRNHYYIAVYENEGTQKSTPTYFQSGVSLNEKGTKDFGDYLMGTKTIYCKVKVKISPGSGISLELHETQKTFNPGTDTTFLDKHIYNSTGYKQYGGVYQIGYTILKSGSKTYSSVSVPLIRKDTLSAAIDY